MSIYTVMLPSVLHSLTDVERFETLLLFRRLEEVSVLVDAPAAEEEAKVEAEAEADGASGSELDPPCFVVSVSRVSNPRLLPLASAREIVEPILRAEQAVLPAYFKFHQPGVENVRAMLRRMWTDEAKLLVAFVDLELNSLFFISPYPRELIKTLLSSAESRIHYQRVQQSMQALLHASRRDASLRQQWQDAKNGNEVVVLYVKTPFEARIVSLRSFIDRLWEIDTKDLHAIEQRERDVWNLGRVRLFMPREHAMMLELSQAYVTEAFASADADADA